MKTPAPLLTATIALLLLPTRGSAAEPDTPASPAAPAGLQLICLTDHPALVEGQSTTLQAWTSTAAGQPVLPAPQLQWHADSGRIAGPPATAHWDLSAVRLNPGEERRLISASVTATREGHTLGACQVAVFLGRDLVIPPDRAAQAEDLFSARHFLLPRGRVADGFGLYSYLLFSAPPRDTEEKNRYLKTIAASLTVMRDVDEFLSRHVRPKKLNVTYIPVTKIAPVAKDPDTWAENVLRVYDYTRAAILLDTVQHSHEAGPYLLSTLGPAQSDSTVRLWEDFTGVAPELTWDRVRFFTYLAAQERTWSQENLRRLALALRNLIAVGGKVLPDAIEAADKAVKFETKVAGARTPQ